jgi:hypothetical protein
MFAMVASVHMAAENGCPAVHQCEKHAPMPRAKQVAEVFEELLSVNADDIGQLAGWSVHYALL